ncbi:S41 family peptidase [Adhaeretor mobilis]|uniref:Tail-specific protease n=1 Tax=Adhaeretor mobilis TaxID=1930276 RepID=A0A517MRR6_9BACT|nr:S41 family peptidase [Adhaeretor mobilis]QDS97579.1 Tail-specific protease precursor [Adhaeretor mobilis]
MSHRNFLVLIGAALVCYACYVRAEQNPYARYMAAGFSVIDRWALEQPPDEELFDGAMQGMIKVLERYGDEHSQFVEARRSDTFREEISQEFGGVGIRLRVLGEPSYPTVIGPPEPGTPAFASDIRSGDRIVAIDGKNTADVPLEEIVTLVRGPKGKSVVLTVIHADEEEKTEVTLLRDIIMVPSILGDLPSEDGKWSYHLPGHPNLGYVRIIKFGEKTVDELREVLGELEKENVRGLILDLRDDYGGALDAAVSICDMFLPVGATIVTTRDRDEKTREKYVSEYEGAYRDLPLAVLINHNSASASEIVAACLQDYHRAIIVGERSYGKGTVQRVMRLESGRSLLKLTSASFWRPSEKNIHRMTGAKETDQWGVFPDSGMEVDLDEKEYLTWRLYRSRRDVPGGSVESKNVQDGNERLFKELDLKDGKLPEDYSDRMLEKAVEALQKQLDH